MHKRPQYTIPLCLVLGLMAAGLVYQALSPVVVPEATRTTGPDVVADTRPAEPARTKTAEGKVADAGKSDETAEEEAETAEEAKPAVSEEERAADAAEAKVEAFENLTDKWETPAKAGVTLNDVDAFVGAFRSVPKDRRDECINRALNLIPDENVMLLAGVLMDRTMDKETVETVFNDLLNREEVKNPILWQILKDKTHPCWNDAKWIHDATAE